MMAWWDALTPALHLFYAVALIGSGLLLMQTILIMIGAEHTDVHFTGAGHDLGGTHSGGLQMLSLRTITAFCTGFGWTGVIALKAGSPLALAVLLGVLAGVLLAWSIMWLMRSMRGLASDGTMQFDSTVGSVGTVIVSIQAHGSTGGQVEILVQGRLAVLNAIGDPAQPPIPPGTTVTVVGLAGANTLLVAPTR